MFRLHWLFLIMLKNIALSSQVIVLSSKFEILNLIFKAEIVWSIGWSILE